LLGFRGRIIVEFTHPLVVERSNFIIFIYNIKFEISFASSCLPLAFASLHRLMLKSKGKKLLISPCPLTKGACSAGKEGDFLEINPILSKIISN